MPQIDGKRACRHQITTPLAQISSKTRGSQRELATVRRFLIILNAVVALLALWFESMPQQAPISMVVLEMNSKTSNLVDDI